MSIYAYLLIKTWEDTSQRIRSVLSQFGRQVLAIYLVHILVLETLRGKGLGFRLYSWMGLPCT